jgi:hypothetical protein
MKISYAGKMANRVRAPTIIVAITFADLHGYLDDSQLPYVVGVV